MFKKCKVVMLPTEKVTQIYIARTGGLGYYNKPTTYTVPGQGQHLYILSDEEIKEGDWTYSFQLAIFKNAFGPLGSVIGSDKFIKEELGAKKVIASTDSSLELPRPSDSFIKKYCELGGIDEVRIEYEDVEVYTRDIPRHLLSPDDRDIIHKVKVAPDNTITIKKIKDNWNRTEVLDLIESFVLSTHHIPLNKHPERDDAINKWIKENL